MKQGGNADYRAADIQDAGYTSAEMQAGYPANETEEAKRATTKMTTLTMNAMRKAKKAMNAMGITKVKARDEELKQEEMKKAGGQGAKDMKDASYTAITMMKNDDSTEETRQEEVGPTEAALKQALEKGKREKMLEEERAKSEPSTAAMSRDNQLLLQAFKDRTLS